MAVVYLRCRTHTHAVLSIRGSMVASRVSGGGGDVGIGADLDISLMDWSCEEKKESGAEGEKEGRQYEQDDVGNKRGME